MVAPEEYRSVYHFPFSYPKGGLAATLSECIKGE
jgi:hypothetical protein